MSDEKLLRSAGLILKDEEIQIHDTTYDTTHDKILAFCIKPHSKAEIGEHCGYKNTKNFTQKYLRPLLDMGSLKMTLPDKPKSKNQKYITTYPKIR